MPRLLDRRREMFCREYLALGGGNGSGTEAAVRAGFSPSRKCASVVASNLLKLEAIQTRLNELTRSQLAKQGLNIKKVIENLAKFASREIMNDPGNDRNTIAANVEIGKMLGAYKDTVRIKTDGKEDAVSVKDLNLPLDVQKAILVAMRQAKEKKQIASAHVTGADSDLEDNDE